MKRAPKVLISLLLLVTMLANLCPAFSFVSTVSAASVGYSYKPATTVVPGREYLVLSSNAVGTAYALAPANGAESSNQNTSTSVKVTINQDGTVTGSDELKTLEWEFIQSAPQTDRASLLYMLQNKSTGAYLWNPAYEVDTDVFGTCITPLQDSYNGSTMAVFDFNVGISATLSGSENLFAGVSGSALFEGPWLKVQSPAGGDGNFTVNFTRGTLACDSWRFMQYTYHTTGKDSMWSTGKTIGIFTNTSDFAGPNADYYYGGVNTAAGWQSPSMDLYASVSNNSYRGSVKSIRIDPVDNHGDGGQFGYVDSVILGKTVAGIQTVAAYRNDVADKRGGGLMPSVEYPFCQFTATRKNGNAYELAFYGTSTNVKSYLIVPASGGSAFRKLATAGNVYLYEKVYDAGVTSEWIISSEFENGEDYVIASVNDGVGVIFNRDGSTVSATVSNGKIISSVPDSATWAAYSNSVINGSIAVNGQKGFWLSNNITRVFLITNGNTVFTDYTHSSAIGNWYGTNLCNNIWNYENGKLISASVNKAQVVGSDNASVKTVSFDNDKLATSDGGNVYIFKKAYHEHDYKEINRIDAECTAAGEVTYSCTCGDVKTEIIPELGHTSAANVSFDESFHGYTCSRCGETVKEAHSIVYSNNNDGTTHTVSCTACNYSVSKPHNNKVEKTEPDCTHPTITTTTCLQCGNVTVEQGSDLAGHKNNAGSVTLKPSCTTTGTLKYSCLVCGQESGTSSLDAFGHMYSDWYNKNATTRAKKCLHCGDEITENYNNYAPDYVYGLVDMPVAGRDYIIANTKYAGKGFAAASVSDTYTSYEWLVSTPITVNAADALCKVPYIKADSVGSNLKWTAEKNGNKFAFKNNETNEYLWARTMTDENSSEWIHTNLGSATNPANKFFSVNAATVSNTDGTTTNTGVGTEFIADSGIQIGFRDNIFSNGFTIPGKNALRFEDSSFHYPVLSYVNADGNVISYKTDEFPEIDGNCVIDLDFSFSDADCCLIIYKPDMNNGLYGQRLEILGGASGTGPKDGTCINFVTNKADSSAPGGYDCDVYLSGTNLNDPKFDGTAIDNGLTVGYNVWHHLRIVCDEATNSTDVYIDNVHVAHQEGWVFDQPCVNTADGIHSNKVSHKGIYMLTWISKTAEKHVNSGMPMRPITYGSNDGRSVWVDNLNVVTDELHIYDDYDNNRNAFYGEDSNLTADFVNFTNPTVVAPEHIAEDVFVANNDVSNKVYIYEKQYKYTVEYYYDGVIDSSLTDTGYKAIGSAVTHANKTKFGYVLDKVTPAGTITVSENTNENVIKVYYVSAGSAIDDAYAVSFAKTAIPGAILADNDTVKDFVDGYTVTGISATLNGDVNTKYETSKLTNETINIDDIEINLKDNGDIIVKSDDVTDINVDFYVEHQYTLNGTVGYIYSKVKIISATSIYFEDNSGLVTYTDGTLQSGESYVWEVDCGENIPNALYNSVYGYSETYNNDAYIRYSAGSSHKITLCGEADYNGGEATASFAFKGTGFDILSHADSTSGIIFVDVYKAVNGEASGSPVKSYFVNNYLGYAYINGEWVVTSEAEAIYQIPTIKVDGLIYGDYVAVITPTYAKDFKERFDGETTFWLDAVRIYNPMESSVDVSTIYANASQYAPQYFDVGELIINSVTSEWKDGAEGIMYITTKSGVTEASDYVKFGPNHEVYLESGDYITFYLTADEIPALSVIGASAVGGSATLTCAYGTSSTDYILKTATDMYYVLSDAEWTFDSELGLYVTDKAYTITAKSGTVALSDIRVSFGAAVGAVSFRSASVAEMSSVVDRVIAVLNRMPGDINGDNLVNARDSLIAKKYMSGAITFSDEQIEALDLNGDGEVTTKDIIKLKKLISQ